MNITHEKIAAIRKERDRRQKSTESDVFDLIRRGEIDDACQNLIFYTDPQEFKMLTNRAEQEFRNAERYESI